MTNVSFDWNISLNILILGSPVSLKDLLIFTPFSFRCLKINQKVLFSPKPNARKRFYKKNFVAQRFTKLWIHNIRKLWNNDVLRLKKNEDFASALVLKSVPAVCYCDF